MEHRQSHSSKIYRQHDDWDEVHNQLLSIQKKSLGVSDPNDANEREADAVANKVVNGETANIQTTSGNINRRGEGSAEVTPGFQSKLINSKGSGQSLDDSTKSDLENKMGADFSGVKIHNDSDAHNLNESINAKAFTHGNDVFFRQGAYNPASKEGKELIAHELVHTKQQENQNNTIQRKFYLSGTETNRKNYLSLLEEASGLEFKFTPGATEKKKKEKSDKAEVKTEEKTKEKKGEVKVKKEKKKVPSQSAKTKVQEIINDTVNFADIHSGEHHADVLMGGIRDDAAQHQDVDMDDIAAGKEVEGFMPSAVLHELYENYDYHKTKGSTFEDKVESHKRGINAETDYLEDIGIKGRRTLYDRTESIDAPPGEKTGPGISYTKGTSVYTHYYLEIIYRLTEITEPAEKNDYEVVSIKRIPRAEAGQVVIDQLASGSTTIPSKLQEGPMTELMSKLWNPNVYNDPIVLIESYTDDVESPSVGETRAVNMKDDFVYGTSQSAKRIVTVNRGAANPVADNKTEEGRAKNRRLVFTVTYYKK